MATTKTRDDLTNSIAIQLFTQLRSEYKKQYGTPDKTVLHLLNDIALLEQIKQECREDIAENGVMVYWKNGENQQGYREHPLIAKLNQAAEQQRKLLGELKLTPASRKQVLQGAGADDFEAF